ncbi:DUF4041 domain-containing protein [Comamonas jiangduensis]|uniref:DUF4041 domain-containing protein n=1 Tax=Comamonas jiangduensis TaxID=1194168 RepID=UPI003BF88318
MGFWLFIAICYIVFFHVKKSKTDKLTKAAFEAHQQEMEQARQVAMSLQESVSNQADEIRTLRLKVETLEPFQACADATQEAQRILQSAYEAREISDQQAKEHYDSVIAQANSLKEETSRLTRDRRAKIESLLKEANEQAALIIRNAKESAERTAGDAYRALKEADALQATAEAMKNIIKGYGKSYLKPTFSLLDELAELYSFDDAGTQLKMARARSLMLVESSKAASCDYVEANRKTTAIDFVLDAFNGKVDSILTRAKVDNYGILEQQIKGAFSIVNFNGSAFRNARITDEYLEARMQELRWAVAVHALQEREKQEQREIRERIREEEKARKEIEKALKDAAKEEEAIEKAMARMRQQIDKATDEQRSKFEAQMAELQQRLAEAEAKSQRAQSMAQQTRAGHVYIISNEGSFGENVFKIGMTRRLEPLDRVRELGDASVPFGFDVHAMIWSEDAPALERALHLEFVKAQLNKVNPRKEFFKVGIKALRLAVEQRGIDVSWTIAAAAAEFKESLAIEERMRADPALENEWLRLQQSYEIQMEETETHLRDEKTFSSGNHPEILESS